MTWTLNNNNSPWGSNPKGNEPNRGNGSFGGDDYFNSFQNKLKDMFPKKTFKLLLSVTYFSNSMDFERFLQGWNR